MGLAASLNEQEAIHGGENLHMGGKQQDHPSFGESFPKPSSLLAGANRFARQPSSESSLASPCVRYCLLRLPGNGAGGNRPVHPNFGRIGSGENRGDEAVLGDHRRSKSSDRSETKVAGSDSSLEQKVLQTNPVLEAFGNAKTVRNNNSSRFGKWIEVHFSDQNRVCGASIECYLLEKSRVVDQQRGERNFHIFYQLLSSPDLCRTYHLSSPSDYRYLTAGNCLQVDGMDDRANFLEVLTSFDSLGFTSAERESVLSLLAAILKLGNIEYEETGGASLHPGSRVANEDLLREAASLLQVPEKALEEAVCTRRISVREGNGVNVTVIPLSCREAVQNCDALAKELYSRLFDWIVEERGYVKCRWRR